MTAGKLDRRVTFSRATPTNTSLGITESWSDIGTVWASRKDVSDGERAAAGMMQATLVSRFMVRSSGFSRALTPKDRLTEGGRSYQILGIKEMGRRDFLEITAEARADL